MGLHNITIEETTIKVGKGEITVRGINLSDMMTIIRVYGPAATLVFNKIQQSKSLDTSDIRTLIGTVAEEFPDMVGAAMALAADSYDADTITIMKKLPFTVQIEVIESVFALTFAGEGEIKKLMESLTRMLTEVSGALSSTTTLTSLNGTGESAAA